MSQAELANSVVPLMNNIVTPKVYDDIVNISLKSENIRRISSSGNGSQLYWELNNLTCNSYLDRKIALEFEITITIPILQAGPGNAPFAVGDIMAPGNVITLRNSPVLMNATNIEISINNQKISYPANAYYEPLSRFENGDVKEALRLNECPNFHDYGAFLAQPAGLLGVFGADNFTHAPNIYNPRGDILPTSVVANAGVPNARDVTYNWTEYLYLPPCTTYDEMSGFYDINSISISISLPATFSKFFTASRVWDGLLNGGVAAITYPAAMTQGSQFMRLYTVTSPFDCPQNFAQMLPAYNITRITTPVAGPVAVGGFADVTSNNVSLTKVPSRILIFATRAGENFGILDANTYGLITNLNVTFGNRSDYFRYYQSYDLWHKLVFSKGNKIPWKYYEKYTGSPLCIEPDKDIYECPPAGTPCCSNFQVQCRITNLYPEQATFQLLIVPIYDSMLTYTRNTFSINDLIVDDKAIIEKAYEEYNSIPQSVPKSLCKIGGSFKDEVINGISKVVGGIQAAMKFYNDNKSWLDPLIADAKELGISAIELASTLFAAGLHPDAVFMKLSAVYPEKDLAPLLRNLKEAGCCCNYQPNWPIAGKVSKKRGKKGGVMIQTESEFEQPKSRLSLRDRM